MDTQTLEFKKKVDDYITAAEKWQKEMEGKSDREISAFRVEFEKKMDEYYDRVRQRNVSLPGSEEGDGKKKFSWARAINAICSRNLDFSHARYEEEVFKETAKLIHPRAAETTMTGANMGFFIPTEIAKEILMPAQAAMVMNTLGCTMYSNLIGELPFPEVTDEPQLSWGSENFEPTGTTVGSAEKMMRPKTGKMLIKLSNKLNYQTAGTAEQIITEQMRKGSQRGLDKICISGKGSTSEPLGILNVTGIVSNKVLVGTNGGRFTIDNAAQLIAEINDRNYDPTGILFHPRVLSGMCRERVEQFSAQGTKKGQPIMINPLMTPENLSAILGLKLARTTNIPKDGAKGSSSTGLAKSIGGDWREFKIGTWGGMQLKTSSEAGNAFAKGELWILIEVDCDTLVGHKEAFEICLDGDTDESHW